jgi:hypothetical protein
MVPVRFNPEEDLEPLPFDKVTCHMAAELKTLGLSWKPHVGCFVWDSEAFIKVESPFPGNIYFILSLPRFIDIFGSIEKMVDKLVWLPTWHQARLLCRQLGVTDQEVADQWRSEAAISPGGDLQYLYRLIGSALKNRNSHQDPLERLIEAATKESLGDTSAIPEELKSCIKHVYHEFIDAYLNALRQKEGKPRDWFPPSWSLDLDLADDMRHFFSDYQNITRDFFRLNARMSRLAEIDEVGQPNLYRHAVDEITLMFERSEVSKD